MSISSTNRKAGPFDGNGTASSFPFYFKVFEATDLLVVLLNIATNVETELQITSNYTVSLNANQDATPGGTVTLVSGALASGYKLTITSNIGNLQPTNLTNQGGFYPDVVEDALDRATIQIQQNAVTLDRSIKVPLSSNVNTELPNPEENTLLGWDANGNIINYDPASLASVAAYATAYADTFTGDGTTTSWVLTRSPGTLYNLDVSINGVTQVPVTDYTLSGTTFTTTTAAPLNSVILVKYKEGLPNYSGDSQDVRYVPSGTGAVATTVQTKLRETVSVKDFGAVGDGVTDDTAAFNLAVTSCVTTGKALIVPSGSYIYTGNLYSLPITLVGEGRPKIYITGRFQFQTDNNILGNTTLSTGASTGATSITVTSATNFSAGQLVVIYDATVMDSAFNRGSYTTAIISSVAGTIINLNDPLVYPLFSGAVVTTRAATGANVSGIDFYMPAVPGSNSYCLVYSGLTNSTLVDCRFFEPTRQKSTLNNALYAQQCYGLEVEDYYSDGPLYGISLIGGRQFNIRNITMYEGRHPVVPSYGSSNIEVDNLVTKNCAAALDAHVAFNISYRNVREYNSTEWFALRALGVTLQNIQSEHVTAPSGSPQLHNDFLTASYSSLNQQLDLEVNNFRIQGSGTASLDISYGRNVRLCNCYWPNITLAISGGTALSVTSAYIDESCVFAAQGNTRIYVTNVNGNKQKLDAVLNSGVYEINTPKSFINTSGYWAKCYGLIYPNTSTTNGTVISIKIYDDFGYAPSGYLRWVSGALKLIVSDVTGTRQLKYGFNHTIVSTSGITFDTTAVTNEAFPASASPSSVTISNITQAGITQVGSSRFSHYISFDITFSLPSTRNVEVKYELDLYGIQ